MIFYSLISSPIYFFYANHRGHGFFDFNTWIGLLIVVLLSFMLEFILKEIRKTSEKSYMKISSVEPVKLVFFTTIVFTGFSIILGTYFLEILLQLKILA